MHMSRTSKYNAIVEQDSTGDGLSGTLGTVTSRTVVCWVDDTASCMCGHLWECPHLAIDNVMVVSCPVQPKDAIGQLDIA